MNGSPVNYQVRLTDDHICLRAPYTALSVCRAVGGGRWSPEWKCWVWPRDEKWARKLLDAFGPKLSSADGGGSLADLVTPIEIARTIVDPGHVPGLKTSPWRHQREAYGFASTLPGAMLAMGMGTGKTLTAIGLSATSQKCLIVCPKAVISVWPKEFEKHAATAPNFLVLNSGTGESKAKQLHTAMKRMGRLVVVLNYESAWRDKLGDEILRHRWDCVLLDECHKIKSPSGKASKFCAKLRKTADRVIGLTGTPMPHSPLDIFAQYRAIAPHIFGTNFHLFKSRYAIMGGFGGHEVKGYQDQEELRAKFLSVAYQAGRDVIELPPATHTVIPVDMGAKARKVYKSLANDLYAQVDQGEVTAANALVKLLRLQQLTGGYLKLDDGSVQHVDDEKQDALSDLLEGMGDEPVIVFCRFRSDLDAVHTQCAKLGLPSMELSGRRNELAHWQAGGAQVIAVQIQSGGVGVDLTRARYCIYYSLGFSLGDYEQSLARPHRPGQDRPVSFYHLVCTGTVDEQVYAALEERRDVVNAILEGIRRKS